MPATDETGGKTGGRARQREDPRRQRTRAAIISAGQKLFGTDYLESVSTEEIISRAGISRQSFYNHFVDKDELARTILYNAGVEIDALVRAANEGEADPAARIATAVCIYARQAQLEPMQGHLLARLPLNDVGKKLDTDLYLVADLIDGLKQHRFSALDISAALAFVVGSTQALINRIMTDRQSALSIPTCRQFVALLLRAFGLSPDEAAGVADAAATRVFARQREAGRPEVEEPARRRQNGRRAGRPATKTDSR